jgi:hypothetical protein
MARNNHPAASLDPSDRANHPFMARPTAAKVTAAAHNRIVEMLRDGASSLRATGRNVTVGGGVTGGSANAEPTDEQPSGINNSDDEDSSFGEAAVFAFCRLPFALPVGAGAIGVGFGLFGLTQGENRRNSLVGRWSRFI